MGQGQSQQASPIEQQEATVVEASPAAPLDSSTAPTQEASPSDTATRPNDGDDDDEMKHVVNPAPTPAPARVEEQETAAASAAETFKVPGLPARPPPQVEAAAVPADIAHIMALGANEPERVDSAVLEQRGQATGSREIADVVKELKAKAAMAVDRENTAAGAGTQAEDAKRRDELVQVEQEMEKMGVKRESVADQVEQKVDGEIEADAPIQAEQVADDVKMEA